jgi:hypothetical protein
MATYQIHQNAYINGTFYEADVNNLKVITLADDVEPSTKWKPIDAAAKAALEALDQKKLEAAKEAQALALNPVKVVPALPKLPKRELVDGAAQELGGPTPDTHERPAPPTVPGTVEQRPQDLGPTESRATAGSPKHGQPQHGQHQKRASDKDAI